jgi:hypothetical protein
MPRAVPKLGHWQGMGPGASGPLGAGGSPQPWYPQALGTTSPLLGSARDVTSGGQGVARTASPSSAAAVDAVAATVAGLADPVMCTEVMQCARTQPGVGSVRGSAPLPLPLPADDTPTATLAILSGLAPGEPVVGAAPPPSGHAAGESTGVVPAEPPLQHSLLGFGQPHQHLWYAALSNNAAAVREIAARFPHIITDAAAGKVSVLRRAAAKGADAAVQALVELAPIAAAAHADLNEALLAAVSKCRADTVAALLRLPAVVMTAATLPPTSGVQGMAGGFSVRGGRLTGGSPIPAALVRGDAAILTLVIECTPLPAWAAAVAATGGHGFNACLLQVRMAILSACHAVLRLSAAQRTARADEIGPCLAQLCAVAPQLCTMPPDEGAWGPAVHVLCVVAAMTPGPAANAALAAMEPHIAAGMKVGPLGSVTAFAAASLPAPNAVALHRLFAAAGLEGGPRVAVAALIGLCCSFTPAEVGTPASDARLAVLLQLPTVASALADPELAGGICHRLMMRLRDAPERSNGSMRAVAMAAPPHHDGGACATKSVLEAPPGLAAALRVPQVAAAAHADDNAALVMASLLGEGGAVRLLVEASPRVAEAAACLSNVVLRLAVDNHVRPPPLSRAGLLSVHAVAPPPPGESAAAVAGKDLVPWLLAHVPAITAAVDAAHPEPYEGPARGHSVLDMTRGLAASGAAWRPAIYAALRSRGQTYGPEHMPVRAKLAVLLARYGADASVLWRGVTLPPGETSPEIVVMTAEPPFAQAPWSSPAARPAKLAILREWSWAKRGAMVLWRARLRAQREGAADGVVQAAVGQDAVVQNAAAAAAATNLGMEALQLPMGAVDKP